MYNIINILRNPFILALLITAIIVNIIIITYESPITSGFVTDKKFVPYHEWETTENSCINIGMGNGISMPVCTPYIAQHSAPDIWYITIKNETDDGESRTRTIVVSKNLYEKVNINDYFMIPDENNE